MASLVDDEQIIKRRLALDGEGVGDDRRVNMLLKQFIKWCNTESNGTDEISMPLNTQIYLSEFSILKSDLSEKMIDGEVQNYKKMSDTIAQKIEVVKEDIEESKKQLVVAQEIRRNKLEYSSLARLIKEQPDRKEIVKKHETLKQELQKQNEEFQKVNKALDNRRKDFACFLMLAKELMKDSDETENAVEEIDIDVDDNLDGMIIDE